MGTRKDRLGEEEEDKRLVVEREGDHEWGKEPKEKE